MTQSMGHGCGLQSCDSRTVLLHDPQQFSFLTFERVRSCFPPAHVAVQVVHEAHELNAQFTGTQAGKLQDCTRPGSPVMHVLLPVVTPQPTLVGLHAPHAVQTVRRLRVGAMYLRRRRIGVLRRRSQGHICVDTRLSAASRGPASPSVALRVASTRPSPLPEVPLVSMSASMTSAWTDSLLGVSSLLLETRRSLGA